MKDSSGNLPFWGKQKPLRHYLKNGVIRFSVRGNELRYKVIYIHKKIITPIIESNVKDKQHLLSLLEMKSIEEIYNRI